MTDFRAELQALVTAYDKLGKWPQHEHEDALFDAVEHARAALAQPAPPEPANALTLTDEELTELMPVNLRADEEDAFAFARAAIALALSRRAPAPPAEVEVAELVARLRRLAPQNPLGIADPTITRAADLLEQRPDAVSIAAEDCLKEIAHAVPFADWDFNIAQIIARGLKSLPDDDGSNEWIENAVGICLGAIHAALAHALPLPAGEVE